MKISHGLLFILFIVTSCSQENAGGQQDPESPPPVTIPQDRNESNELRTARDPSHLCHLFSDIPCAVEAGPIPRRFSVDRIRGNYSLLGQMAQESGLLDRLEKKPYTIVLPFNEAVQSYLESKGISLEEFSKTPEAEYLVRSHIIYPYFDINELNNENNTYYDLNGNLVTIERARGFCPYTINGAEIVECGNSLNSKQYGSVYQSSNLIKPSSTPPALNGTSSGLNPFCEERTDLACTAEAGSDPPAFSTDRLRRSSNLMARLAQASGILDRLEKRPYTIMLPFDGVTQVYLSSRKTTLEEFSGTPEAEYLVRSHIIYPHFNAREPDNENKTFYDLNNNPVNIESAGGLCPYRINGVEIVYCYDDTNAERYGSIYTSLDVIESSSTSPSE